MKTRLASACGEWRAARLHAALTQRALATALAARVGVVELHGAPAGHRLLRRLARNMRVAVRPQRGSDLGERMQQAFADALRRHRHVVLIGSDCPALTTTDLRLAVRCLRGASDAVLAPAEDGGYVLIGLRRLRDALFADMAWGEASVLADTARAAREQGLRVRLLRTLWDVDRPEDLARLRSLRYRAGSRRAARR